MDARARPDETKRMVEFEEEELDQGQLEVRIGRDEMNLAEFPFTLLSHRVPEGVNTIKFTDTISGKDGKSVIREWTITGSEAYGLPVAGDE